jgi:hypothetical protein
MALAPFSPAAWSLRSGSGDFSACGGAGDTVLKKIFTKAFPTPLTKQTAHLFSLW